MIKSENGKVTIAGTEACIYHEMLALNKAYYEMIAKNKTKFGAELWMDRLNREVKKYIEELEDNK